MKFARYLEDTQTPEWKRAYIDYRKLKRCVREISGVQLERSRSGPSSRTSVRSGPTAPGVGPDGVVVSSARTPRGSPLTFRGANPLPPASEHSFTPSRAGREADRLSDNRLPFPTYGSHGHSPPLTRMSSAREPEPTSPMTELPPALQDPADGRVPTSSGQDWQTDPRNTSRRRLSLSAQISTSVQRTYSLNEIYHTLPPPELRFFDILDKELDKVEKFYLEKLEELVIFSSLLNEQLRELEAHRKVYHDNSAAASRHWGLVGDALHIITTSQGRTRAEGPSDEFSSTQEQISGAPPPRDPDLYHQNKKKLKKATREHYRGIELLNDYRILNLTGFRKALKKFQKVTRIPAQQPYMTEKVDNCVFASETKMLEMISNIESLYALHFTDGDKKVARERLRDTMQGNPQHTRSFRSGLYTGLGIAALSRVIFLSTIRYNHIADFN
ncbi:SPX domain-containing protein [Cantharellus anzutake]|uniref:SPX domain-containing protein n=1 Tax=Cantharellus anzutake TaxID=1750568 RepID=UPI001903EF0B|nr:SPX domain-containing protein [Cantharellus anzutake]KAF8320211.1 SPX domain-containing protein [Cantharellus anzutake]